MLGVSTRSLYIDPVAVPVSRAACEVSSASPLLRQLLIEAFEMPLAYDAQGRDGVLATLALLEISQARALFVSERSFSRLFREQTQMSFGQWRQQTCVVLAPSRLSSGDSVTRIALDLGYERPAAFSTMFRRLTGYTPSAYFEDLRTV